MSGYLPNTQGVYNSVSARRIGVWSLILWVVPWIAQAQENPGEKQEPTEAVEEAEASPDKTESPLEEEPAETVEEAEASPEEIGSPLGEEPAETVEEAEVLPEEAGSPLGEKPAEAVEQAEASPEETDSSLEENGDTADFAELSLEELLQVTVTAAKTEQTLEQAPSIVEVITFQDIRRRGYRTVSEALRHISGLAVIDDYLYDNVGVRGVFSSTGSANDIIKVMINGQPVSFRSTSVNFLGHDLIPIEAVEKIEVIRGPGSALYGANAFLGVINIITFQGGAEEESMHPDHAVALDGYAIQNFETSPFTGAASFYSSAEFGKFKYFLTGTLHRADRSGLMVPGVNDFIQDTMYHQTPEYVDPAEGKPSPGWDRDARRYMLLNAISEGDVEYTSSVYGIGSYQLSDDFAVQLDSHFQYFDRHAEFQDFSFLTHETRLTHLNGYIRPRLTYGADQTEGFSFDLSTAIAGGMPTGDEHIVDRFLQDSYKRRNFGYQAVDVAAEARYTFSENDMLTLGADFTNDWEDLLSMEVVNTRTQEVTEEPGFDDRTFFNVGVYTQWMWNPWDKLVTTLGSRIDHNNVIACDSQQWDCVGDLKDKTVSDDILIDNRGLFQFSNRAAAVYTFPVLDLYTKVIYGSSFKPPSPFQLYHNQLTLSGSSIGNPSLKPQTADTVEATVGLRPFDGFKTSVVGFFTHVDDVVLFLKEGTRLEGRNADLESGGIEAKVSFSWEQTISVFANSTIIVYNRLKPSKKRDETDFTWDHSVFNTVVPTGRFPDFMLNAGINLQPPNSYINTNLTVRYVGSRRASLVNNQLYNHLDLDNTYKLSDYLVADLTVSSVGLHLIGDRETVFSASARGLGWNFIEPGVGGIDIPSLGPRFFFRIEQQL